MHIFLRIIIIFADLCISKKVNNHIFRHLLTWTQTIAALYSELIYFPRFVRAVRFELRILWYILINITILNKIIKLIAMGSQLLTEFPFMCGAARGFHLIAVSMKEACQICSTVHSM